MYSHFGGVGVARCQTRVALLQALIQRHDRSSHFIGLLSRCQTRVALLRALPQEDAVVSSHFGG